MEGGGRPQPRRRRYHAWKKGKRGSVTLASSAAAGRDGVSTAKTSVADIAGSAEDAVRGSLVNRHAIESRRRGEDFDGEDTAAPVTDRTSTGPGARPLVLTATSYDRDSPLNHYASGSAAHSRRKASHAPTVAAAAANAYHIANGATRGVQAAPKATSADGVAPNTAAASTGEGDARIAIVGDTATTADYITVCQAILAVICDIAREAGADDGPHVDRDATLDTGGGASARNVSAVSLQTGATAATKDDTDDARGALGGKS